jgi:hypothetical protein
MIHGGMMRSLSLLIPILFLLFVSNSSCIPDLGDEIFIVKVDSVQSPQSVHLNETMSFALFGIVGPDGAYSFSHIQARKTALHTDLTVWGKRRDAGAHHTAVVMLEGVFYRERATVPGLFELTVQQPDRTFLRYRVLVLNSGAP